MIAEVLATAGDALMRIDFLKSDHFSERMNRSAFDAARSVWEGGGKPDAVVVAEALRDVGVPEALSIISDFAKYRGDTTSLEEQARIVQSKWLSRELVRLGEETKSAAYRSEPMEVLDGLETALQSLRPESASGLQHLLSGEGESLSGESRTTKSGFVPLDAYLGDLGAGRLITLAARPGVGKTTLAFDIASNVAAAGLGVAAFSLEMGRDEIVERLIMRTSRIPKAKFRRHELDFREVESVAKALVEMERWPLYIDDSSGLTPYEISARTRKLNHERGVGLVVVDYVQLVTPPQADSREQEVSASVRAFKHLARDLGVPVLMLSQLSRAAEIRGGEPRMSDLRESGGIENDSDQIFALWRDNEGVDDGRVSVTHVSILKNRHGDTGRFSLSMIKDESRFERSVV